MSRSRRERQFDKGVRQGRREVKDHYRRAKINHQNPRTGKPTRPPKKQGCLTMTAVAALSVGAAVAGIVLTVRGIA